jgi:tRNA(adenine34) deaminase
VTDHELMELALAQAALASAHGDIPIGAVIVDGTGTLLAAAHNERESRQDPTAHAEILAIREAARTRGTWRLDGCTIAITMEPCPMCAGAISQSRLDHVVFGAWNEEYGAAGSHWDLLRDRRVAHRPQVLGGVMADTCGTLVREFLGSMRTS